MLVLLINILRFIQLVVFFRVILTWIMPGRLPAIIQPVAAKIDTVLRRFQVLIPAGPGYIDLGPMLFLLLLEAAGRLLASFYLSGLLR
jgi:uncharacterized protein YggT (Ycf19 family)